MAIDEYDAEQQRQNEELFAASNHHHSGYDDWQGADTPKHESWHGVQNFVDNGADAAKELTRKLAEDNKTSLDDG
eukprot:6740301-Karenia_brevis.AAC.1